MQLQAQVQQQRLHAAEQHAVEQRRDMSTVQRAQQRMDADAQIAFNAEPVAFASKYELDLRDGQVAGTVGAASALASGRPICSPPRRAYNGPAAAVERGAPSTPTSALFARVL